MGLSITLGKIRDKMLKREETVRYSSAIYDDNGYTLFKVVFCSRAREKEITLEEIIKYGKVHISDVLSYTEVQNIEKKYYEHCAYIYKDIYGDDANE